MHPTCAFSNAVPISFSFPSPEAGSCVSSFLLSGDGVGVAAHTGWADAAAAEGVAEGEAVAGGEARLGRYCQLLIRLTMPKWPFSEA